jgi:hypothetical protein
VKRPHSRVGFAVLLPRPIPVQICRGTACRAPTVGFSPDGTLRASARPVVKLVEIYLAAECVPMNSEQACGARLVAARPVQDAFDELLFKFVDGFVKLNATFHHLPDKGLQLIFHGCTLRTRIGYSRKYEPDLPEFVAC